MSGYANGEWICDELHKRSFMKIVSSAGIQKWDPYAYWHSFATTSYKKKKILHLWEHKMETRSATVQPVHLTCTTVHHLGQPIGNCRWERDCLCMPGKKVWSKKKRECIGTTLYFEVAYRSSGNEKFRFQNVLGRQFSQSPTTFPISPYPVGG